MLRDRDIVLDRDADMAGKPPATVKEPFNVFSESSLASSEPNVTEGSLSVSVSALDLEETLLSSSETSKPILDTVATGFSTSSMEPPISFATTSKS